MMPDHKATLNDVITKSTSLFNSTERDKYINK